MPNSSKQVEKHTCEHSDGRGEGGNNRETARCELEVKDSARVEW